MTAYMAPRHDSCTHAKYRMTCDEYDELHATAQGRCQICGQIERYINGGRLNIDHDHAIGPWAVRGLLCISCNVSLAHGSISGPEVDAYLHDPWHQQRSNRSELNVSSALRLLRKASDERVAAKQRHLRGWRALDAGIRQLAEMALRLGATESEVIAASRTILSRSDLQGAHA